MGGILKKIEKDNSEKCCGLLSKIEILIEFLFKQFSSGVKIIGPLFAFCLVLFLAIGLAAFIRSIVPYWYPQFGSFFIIIISFMGITHFCYILFNYFMAVFVKPGSVQEIKQSKLYKVKDPYEIKNPNIDFEFLVRSVPSKILNSLNASEEECTTIIQVNEKTNVYHFKTCPICKEIKPLRAHHCTVCGYCVFKMDHHCPWINNCVGQNNQRYFILFLVHLLLGCFYFAVLSIPIFFYPGSFSRLPPEFKFISSLSMAGCVMLLFFNVWNWYLVVNGNTSIEFWSNKIGVNMPIRNFGMENWRDNLYLVFGTRSLLECLFLPSIRRLPYSGLEWSVLVNPKFTIGEFFWQTNESETQV